MEEVERRKQAISDKIMSWLSNKWNFYFLIILIFAIVLRIWVFYITKNQPLWWDEADYMTKAKAVAFDTPLTGWNSAREVVAPFIWGFFFMLTKSEILARLLQIAISAGIVILIYLFGKKVFNEKVGLIGAFISAVSAMFLFYTGRLLTYMWAPFFFLLTFYLFWEAYYENKGRIYTILAPISGAVGIAVYGSMFFGIAALGLFLFLTEGYKFLLKKKIWIMAVIGVIALLPNLIYFYFLTGDPFIRWHYGVRTATSPDWSFLFGYIKLFPHLFGTIFTILISLSFLYVLFESAISFDLVIKANDKEKGKNPILFLVLWAVIVIGFYTWIALTTKTVWESFIFSAFPALFLIVGVTLDSLYKIKIKKAYVTIGIILLLAAGGYAQISYANDIIKSKVDSYGQIREAGEWLKLNTPKDATIYTTSVPQLTYYSERATVRIPNNASDMDAINISGSSYYMFSVFERQSELDWMLKYPQEKNYTAVAAFYFDAQKKQLAAVIFKM